MKNSRLSKQALLVAVTISQWTGRKQDSKATETANRVHKAATGSGTYNKKLLPGATELELIGTIAGQARAYFYENTLPWMTDGSRMIKSSHYMKFAAEFKKFRNQFEEAVKNFEAAYPRLQGEAKKKLGDLYNEDEYPSKSEIKGKFVLDVNYLPLPDVKDFRVQVSEAEKRQFLEKMKQVEAAATKECWQRLHDVVRTAAEKLSSPEAIFRDSLIKNIQDMTAILPALNITDDKQLEASRKEIEKLVSGLSVENLRDKENKAEREKAAKSLSEIEDRMGAFFTDKK